MTIAADGMAHGDRPHHGCVISEQRDVLVTAAPCDKILSVTPAQGLVRSKPLLRDAIKLGVELVLDVSIKLYFL